MVNVMSIAPTALMPIGRVRTSVYACPVSVLGGFDHQEKATGFAATTTDLRGIPPRGISPA